MSGVANPGAVSRTLKAAGFRRRESGRLPGFEVKGSRATGVAVVFNFDPDVPTSAYAEALLAKGYQVTDFGTFLNVYGKES